MQALYEQISEYWAPKVKSRKSKSVVSMDDHQDDACCDQDPYSKQDDPDDPPSDVPLENDMGEAVLAQQLGVDVVHAVEPCPDSQIPPDSMDNQSASCEKAAMETELDTLDNQSQSLTPTEIEKIPPSKDVVVIAESPVPIKTTINGDPMPSKHMYSAQDLDKLRARIAELKLLSIISVGL